MSSNESKERPKSPGSNASKEHRNQKLFRFVVLTMCTLGCTYQISSFLSLFFTYPSVVNVELIYPDFVPTPSITVCNHNGLKRRLFCEDEEDKCMLTERGEELCEANPELCKNKTFLSYYLLPEADNMESEIAEDLSKMFKYGHQENMLLDCFVSWAPDYNPCRRDRLVHSNLQGPFEISRNCFIINSLSELPPSPISALPLQTSDVGTYLSFVIDFEPQDYFQAKRRLEAYVLIDSPFHLGEPYTTALIAKPGMEYNLQIMVDETLLLPFPYQTNCTDYEALWKLNNFTGPLTQKACEDQCIISTALELCDCIPTFVPFNMAKVNESMKVCIRSEEEDACVNQIDISHCADLCGKECRYLSYTVEIFESVFEHPPKVLDYRDPEFGPRNLGISYEDDEANYIPFMDNPPSYHNIFSKDRFAKVTIRLKKPEMLMYRQKPKFETIELFSYVGSYLGMWLGICLVTFTDMFEDFVEHKLIPWYNSKKNNLLK